LINYQFLLGNFSIESRDVQKIYEINPRLHDNLAQFDDLISIYKTEARGKYCDSNDKICDEFGKYERLVAEEIRKIEEIKEVTRIIRFGPKKGEMETRIITESRTIITCFDSSECEIWSSPFLRCLQTAAFIAKLLGVDSINVHYGLSELCDPDVLKSFRDDLMGGSNININEVFDNTMSRIGVVPIGAVVKDKYEEINDTEHARYTDRINSTVRFIRDTSLKSNVFIVSHADSIKQFNVIPDGIGMDYYIKYDITDKIGMSGGGNNSVLQQYKLYLRKIEKYNKKINKLKFNKSLI